MMYVYLTVKAYLIAW